MVKISFDWKAILGIGAIAGLGYVAYKFYKGDWKLPDLGEILKGAAAPIIPPIVPTTPLPFVGGTPAPGYGVPTTIAATLGLPYAPFTNAPEGLPAEARAAAGIADWVRDLFGVELKEPPTPPQPQYVHEITAPPVTYEVAAPYYAAIEAAPTAPISTAIGSQFQKTTGRYLPQ